MKRILLILPFLAFLACDKLPEKVIVYKWDTLYVDVPTYVYDTILKPYPVYIQDQEWKDSMDAVFYMAKLRILHQTDSVNAVIDEQWNELIYHSDLLEKGRQRLTFLVDSNQAEIERKEADLLELYASSLIEVAEFRRLAQAEVDSMRDEMFRTGDSIYNSLKDLSILDVQDLLDYNNLFILDPDSVLRIGFDSTGVPVIWVERQ